MSAQPAQFRLPFSHYASLGYHPIPTNGKVPVGGVGWNQRVYTQQEYLGLDATEYNVGLLCSNVVGIDIDVQNAAHAKAIERVVRKILKLPKDAPRRVGAAPKALFICRVSSPLKGFDLAHDHEGKRSVLFQLLGQGKQFVVDGTHPDTHKPYTLNAPLPKWDRLPEVTPEMVDALRATLTETLTGLGYDVHATSASGKKGTGKFSDPFPWTDIGMAQAAEALGALDPDMTMNEWVQVGFAVYDGTHGSQEGLELWDAWSQGGDKYKPGDCAKRWRGFKPGGGVTRATLFKNTFPTITGPATARHVAETVGEEGEAYEGPLPFQGGIDLGKLSGHVTSEIPWIVRGLCAPGAMLLVGRPKGGKSLLTTDLVYAVANGTPLYGRQSSRSEVLWLASEDDTDGLVRRLRRRNEPFPTGVKLYTGDALRAERASGWNDCTLSMFLDQYLEHHPRTRLVVVDTHATSEFIWQGDEKQSKGSVTLAAYKMARVYQDIGLARGVCIVLVHHSRKTRPGREVNDYHELINLPQTIVAGVTTSAVLADHPDRDPLGLDEPRRIWAVRGRHMKDTAEQLTLTEMLSFKLDGTFFEQRQTDLQVRILEAVEAMQEGDAFVAVEDIAAESGTSKQAVKNALRAMRRDPAKLIWKGRRVETRRGRNGGVRLVD
jgi:hypothetical protein